MPATLLNDVCTCWAIQLQCSWPCFAPALLFDLRPRPSATAGCWKGFCLFEHATLGKGREEFQLSVGTLGQ